MMISEWNRVMVNRLMVKALADTLQKPLDGCL